MMRRGRPGRPGSNAGPRFISPGWRDQTIQDVRLAVRGLGRRPGFAVAAILTFALGIGASTAIFSLVDFVPFRPLPYRDPGALVRIWSSNPRGIQRNSMSPADFFIASLAHHEGTMATKTRNTKTFRGFASRSS